MVQLSHLLPRVMRGSAIRAIGTVAGATGLGQVAILATLPLLSRLYEPSAFGIYALVATFVAFMSVAACLCLDVAIVQASTVESADEICAAALFCAPLVAIVSTVGLGIFITVGLFGYALLPLWALPIAGGMIFLNGVYLACRYRLLRDQDYDVIARATLFQGVGRAFAPAAWAVVLPGWLGLGLGELTGRLIGVRGVVRPLISRLRTQTVWASLPRWWEIVRRERRYTALLLTSVLVDSGSALLVAPMLAGAYGTHAVGEYFLVFTMLVAPSALICTAAADVIHTRAARLYIGAPSQLQAFAGVAAISLLGVGCVIYLAIYFLAPAVFPIVLGSEWSRSAEIAQALTPFFVVSFVASPCGRLLVVTGRVGWKIVSDTLRLAGIPLTIVAAAYFKLSFVTAVWTLGWFLAFAYGVYFLLAYSSTLRVRYQEAL